LFLHVCDRWPAIRVAADVALRNFVSSPDQRTKEATPWLAYILQLLTVSNVAWEEVRQAFVEEQMARSAQFIKAAFPEYRPIDPNIEEIPQNQQSDEWELREDHHGSEKNPGIVGAAELWPGCWRGRPRGWCSLIGRPRSGNGRYAFRVRVTSLPKDAVLQVGWTERPEEGAFGGLTYYSDGGCFGGRSWCAGARTSEQKTWKTYGQAFKEGDVLTVLIDRGRISFLHNSTNLGCPFGLTSSEIRPLVAMRRQAEVEISVDDTCFSGAFATPQQTRDLAWGSRLTKRGNTLVLFQVFFLTLVRGSSEGRATWEALKQEYDSRLGFPSARLSAALAEHFGKVHRVAALPGSTGWPAFFELLGFGTMTPADVDRMLFDAHKRASELNYKMGGRHDHA